MGHIVLVCLSFLYLSGPTECQQCGGLTTNDAEGPFFVANANFDYALAPSNEISDGKEGVILRGRVMMNNTKIYITFY